MALCDAGVTMGEYLTNFEFIAAFACTYFTAAGALVTGLFVYGGVALVLYIRTGSPVIPFVLLLVVGGAVVPAVAPVANPVVVLVLLGVPAGVVTLAAYRYMG